jgi:hypothetical protein
MCKLAKRHIARMVNIAAEPDPSVWPWFSNHKS